VAACQVDHFPRGNSSTTSHQVDRLIKATALEEPAPLDSTCMTLLVSTTSQVAAHWCLNATSQPQICTSLPQPALTKFSTVLNMEDVPAIKKEICLPKCLRSIIISPISTGLRSKNSSRLSKRSSLLSEKLNPQKLSLL